MRLEKAQDLCVGGHRGRRTVRARETRKDDERGRRERQRLKGESSYCRVRRSVVGGLTGPSECVIGTFVGAARSCACTCHHRANEDLRNKGARKKAVRDKDALHM